MIVTDDELDRAAAILRRGGLVAFPTETVYGLGANALDRDAVNKIYEAKGRPSTSPLIVHVATMDMVNQVAREWPPAAQQLANRFWPGPLTLVVRKTSHVPDEVTAGLDTVGVRMPRHPVALELIRRADVPIAAPSANRFMRLSPTTADHVRFGLGDRVEMILDCGPCEIGIESTVLSLASGTPLLLRPGMIGLADLEAVIGPIATASPDTSLAHPSPGLHPRHYAPRTPLYVLAENDFTPEGRGKVLELPLDAQSYAAHLYAALHAADTEQWDWIAVHKPPQTPEWAAIWDRLRRASASRFEVEDNH